MADARMRRVTEVLIRHGHYVDPEATGDLDVIEWMRVDAERVLDGPLIDTGVHDPQDCNDACVSDLLEVLGG